MKFRVTVAVCAVLALAGLGYALAQMQANSASQNASKTDKSSEGDKAMIRVKVVNQKGELVGPIETEKLVLTDAQWHKRLSDEQFGVLRSKGTERPFCGTLLDNKQEGVYTCAGCGLPLFSSDSKFHSGTGWPSFFQPIAKENIIEQTDHSYGMTRTEINCARCDGHLGHVFDDGPKPTGLRFCLNLASLNFTPSDKLATLADPIADQPKSRESGVGGRKASDSGERASAIFAGGCFWCTEAAFEQIEGVLDVTSGYSGGKKETANYERVCDGDTGHAEVIRVTYDPKRVTYDQLLDIFFDAHDPTQLNHQGNDYGTQYRSAIFYADEKQRNAAEAKIKQLTDAKVFEEPIVTKLERLTAFYPAEDYHQDYARNNPNQPYIATHAVPAACAVRAKHPNLVKQGALTP
jgi:peptide methionine sulfoxide reductase msrA/msrB